MPIDTLQLGPHLSFHCAPPTPNNASLASTSTFEAPELVRSFLRVCNSYPASAVHRFFLKTQFRMTPQINTLISNTYYDTALVSHPSTRLHNRATAIFPRLLLLNCKQIPDLVQAKRRDEASAAGTVIVHQMLSSVLGGSEDIIVVSPYKNQ